MQDSDHLKSLNSGTGVISSYSQHQALVDNLDQCVLLNRSAIALQNFLPYNPQRRSYGPNDLFSQIVYLLSRALRLLRYALGKHG